MSYETRTYDNEHGDPVVVLVATGTHDVSRLVNLLNRGNSEQIGLGHKVVSQVKRHNAGRAALRLLRDHGGPDFTDQGEKAAAINRHDVSVPVRPPVAWVCACDEDNVRCPVHGWVARAASTR